MKEELDTTDHRSLLNNKKGDQLSRYQSVNTLIKSAKIPLKDACKQMGISLEIYMAVRKNQVGKN